MQVFPLEECLRAASGAVVVIASEGNAYELTSH